ncbi:MAG: ABC transporter permease [Longimicrobiaceae bacterium]
MQTLLQDLRFALRTLLRSPAFAGVAILTLALGIGAVATLFSVVDGVLLRPLPFREPDRLVSVSPALLRGEYVLARDRSRSFAELGGYQGGVGFGLSGGGEPERVTGAYASTNLFAALGAEPLLGRGFAAGEDQPGRGAVVVLGHGLWRRRFGGDPAAVGRTVTLDGEPRTVVGVMPAEFRFPSAETELWVPVPLDPAPHAVGALWGMGGFQAVGRLAPGATPRQALAELGALARAMRAENPLWTPPEPYRADAAVVPLRDAVVGEVRPTLLVLLAAVGFVLLIACANVANLLLARGLGRAREMALRSALGAGRGRLVRQLLTESLVLALAGGAAGLLLASWGLRWLVAALPADTPRLAEVALDGRVTALALGATLLTGVAAGLLPAWRVTRRELQGPLREGAGAGGGRRRLSGVLVAAEIGLAMVLVVGAGLLIRSVRALVAVDPGFRTERVVSARIDPPESLYGDPARQRAFYAEVLGRVQALPGVGAAGLTSQLPLGGEPSSWATAVEGVTLDPNALPMFDRRAVTPEYLRTLGVRLVRGRAFTAADREDAPPVALVDEAAARRFWPAEDPVGKRIGHPWANDWMTVVGVVAEVRSAGLAGEQNPAYYVPFAQKPGAGMTLVARTTSPPEALAGSLRAVVAGVDPRVPVSRVRAMDEWVAQSVARPRLTAVLLGAFAGLALLLGAVGVYGVVAYTVGERTREIGLRIALGAGVGDVVGMVLRQGALLAAAGIGAGLLASLAATRALAGLLYGVTATDPLTFAVVPAILAAAALLATWLPARRASRVDPMSALRGD